MRNLMISNVLGLLGAALGGVLGYQLFFWIVHQGLYGMIIPGALMGFGTSLLASHRSLARGIVVGIAAVGLGLWTEWRYSPFKADDSFLYLVKHVSSLLPMTQLMILVGGLFGFWMARDANPIFVLGQGRQSGDSARRD